MDSPAEVEVVEERHPSAYGFTVKAHRNGRLHRIVPARDPSQPRFWCITVYRCTPGGLPDASERPWLGPGGLRREDLTDAMVAIRVDLSAWLAEEAHRALREWMLAPTPEPTAGPHR